MVECIYKMKKEDNNMSTFKLWQVHLTDEEIDVINKHGHGAVEKHRLHLDIQFKETTMWSIDKMFSKKYFTHVANIKANNLEDVFKIGNIGPEENITRLAPMHSVSVGDIVEDENGNRHVVSNFGFESI